MFLIQVHEKKYNSYERGLTLSLKKTALDEPVILHSNQEVTVTRMNHIVEIQHMKTTNKKAHIQKISKDEYINLATGEICEFKKNENRSQNANSLAKSFKAMRYLINNNFVGNPNELFITLTFAKDSFDPKMVYTDCDHFLKRIRYFFKDQSTIDYINVVEPHASGQFHTHMLLRFNDIETVHLTNARLHDLWGLGMVDVKTLENVDNIGAYLSAYLSDLELPEENTYNDQREDIKIKEVNGKKKKYLKGGRLAFYPSDMKIVRSSKGIKKPEREKTTYGKIKEDIKKEAGIITPNFAKSVSLSSEDYSNTITYEQYNLKRDKIQKKL